MKHSKYQHHIGATVAYTKTMMEATKGVRQRYRKGATKDFFIFENWFSSNKSEEAAMGVVADLIGVVKTNKI